MNQDDKYKYERILKITGDYTLNDLRKAYKRAAKLYHPDIAQFRGISVEAAEENMKRVNQAHTELSFLFDQWPNPEFIASDYFAEDSFTDDGGIYVFDEDVFVGALIEFGKYPTGSKKQFRPILWYVLEIRDNRALIVTDQCVDCRPFNNLLKNANWAESNLRQWVNTVFIDRAFAESEKGQILNTRVAFEHFVGSSKTTSVCLDKMFMLGTEEAETLFANWEDRATSATDFAVERGAVQSDEGTFWWLRDAARICDSVCYVDDKGFVHSHDGRLDDATNIAVRPACWIELKRKAWDKSELEASRIRKRKEAEDKATREKVRAQEEAARADAKRQKYYDDRKEAEAAARAQGAKPIDANLRIGDTVEFGKYPEEGVTSLSWDVLDIDDGRSLLIASKAVDMRVFSVLTSTSDWEESGLRKWLNDDFLYAAFSDVERSVIAVVRTGEHNSEICDKVFCLSQDEAEKYFLDDAQRRVRATEYACAKRDKTCDAHVSWWLRTSGKYDDSFTMSVTEEGAIFKLGLLASCSGVGVRPALWINL